MTGAAGLIGSRVRSGLARRYEVVGVDKTASSLEEDAVAPVDLTEYGQVRSALEGSDALVHLAIASERALSRMDAHAYAAEEVRANVLGTRNVFEAAAEAGVRRVVFMSSLTVYMGSPALARVTPDTPLQPRNHYSITKLYGEQLAWWYAANERFGCVCWRLGQPYPVEHFGLEHLRDPAARSCAISTDDIGRGIFAGLEAELPADGRGGLPTGFRATPGHVVANLVSASDVGPAYGYDLAAAKALGYFPGDCFTANGPIPHNPETHDSEPAA
ncbi:MAG: NAD(P)-dependent oxidoreductase [Planctomycetota bacterium]